jgi:UDP-2,3-diacylglucosamine pyrophosphatase LpxH
MWRYKLPKVLERREPLLNKLDALHARYIAGNHDCELLENPAIRRQHKFFSRIEKQIHLKTPGPEIKIMHGHEVDPFVPEKTGPLTKFLGQMHFMFEFNSQAGVLHMDLIQDLFCEIGEQFIKNYQRLGSLVSKQLRHYYSLSNDSFARLKRSLRTRRMLSRYHTDKHHGLYDIAVVGHTHKAGRFDNWYYNCGSWTGKVNNFMVINPDGSIEIFDWTKLGPQKNNTLIASH